MDKVPRMEWPFRSDKGRVLGRAGAGLHRPGIRGLAGCTPRARNPHFCAILEKRKSAKEKAAGQSGNDSCSRVWGLSLLRWQSDSLLCGLGSPGRRGLCPCLRQQGLAFQSPTVGAEARPWAQRAGRREGGRDGAQQRGTKSPPGEEGDSEAEEKEEEQRMSSEAGNPPSPESPAPGCCWGRSHPLRPQRVSLGGWKSLSPNHKHGSH